MGRMTEADDSKILLVCTSHIRFEREVRANGSMTGVSPWSIVSAMLAASIELW